ncbi:hypothetical protein [Helicobacter pylori]|nr:hypothetical protein [Helicobacter pylori]
MKIRVIIGALEALIYRREQMLHSSQALGLNATKYLVSLHNGSLICVSF